MITRGVQNRVLCSLHTELYVCEEDGVRTSHVDCCGYVCTITCSNIGTIIASPWKLMGSFISGLISHSAWTDRRIFRILCVFCDNSFQFPDAECVVDVSEFGCNYRSILGINWIMPARGKAWRRGIHFKTMPTTSPRANLADIFKPSKHRKVLGTKTRARLPQPCLSKSRGEILNREYVRVRDLCLQAGQRCFE